jgi:SWI/SNF-related matrix-associated actin-dependent regulator 1 of chromatin subfamily A
MTSGDEVRSKYEKDRIAHAKRIMQPFFLRRLKSEVLTALPQKSEEVIKVPMTAAQHENYFKTVAEYKKRAKDVRRTYSTRAANISHYFVFCFRLLLV